MEITLRRCPNCREMYLNDVEICPSCPQVTQTVETKAPGNGTIYSFTRVHVAPEQFQSIVPYYLAIVQLEAGPRLIARVRTDEGDHVRVDAPVELASVDNGYTFTLK